MLDKHQVITYNHTITCFMLQLAERGYEVAQDFEDMRRTDMPTSVLECLRDAAEDAWQTYAALENAVEIVTGLGEDSNPNKRGPIYDLIGRAYALLQDLRAEGMRQLAEWEKLEPVQAGKEDTVSTHEG